MHSGSNLVTSGDDTYSIVELKASAGVKVGENVNIGANGTVSNAVSASGEVAIADSSTREIGDSFATNEQVRVILPNRGCIIKVLTSAAAVSDGDDLSAAANGEFAKTVTGSGSTVANKVAVALGAKDSNNIVNAIIVR